MDRQHTGNPAHPGSGNHAGGRNLEGSPLSRTLEALIHAFYQHRHAGGKVEVEGVAAEFVETVGEAAAIIRWVIHLKVVSIEATSLNY